VTATPRIFVEGIGELMSKTMSLEPIVAHQQNARKSTGPRTANGRAVSKMNALQHGILGKAQGRSRWRSRKGAESEQLFFAKRTHLGPQNQTQDHEHQEIYTTSPTGFPDNTAPAAN
jgi:hypothetical protein